MSLLDPFVCRRCGKNFVAEADAEGEQCRYTHLNRHGDLVEVVRAKHWVITATISVEGEPSEDDEDD